MADINETPLSANQIKTATSRIDLNRAKVAAPASTAGIRIGVNPKQATSRIEISAIPGAAKAQTSRVGLGAMPVADDDVYKRRTALLDTANLPLSASPSAQPRTIRIGGRPTVRVGSSAPATFSPGRSSDGAEAASPAGSSRPTIKLKRPGGATSTMTVSSGGSTAPSFSPEPAFTVQSSDDEVGGVWTVFSILSLLVAIGLIVVQVMTMKGMAY